MSHHLVGQEPLEPSAEGRPPGPGSGASLEECPPWLTSGERLPGHLLTPRGVRWSHHFCESLLPLGLGPCSYKLAFALVSFLALLVVGAVTYTRAPSLLLAVAGNAVQAPTRLAAEATGNCTWVPEGVECRRGTGCSNWDRIRLGKALTMDSAATCAAECQKTAGCQGIGYQAEPTAKECDGEAIGAGACYLWGGPCACETNVCWEDYRLNTTLTAELAPWSLRKARTGCTNWNQIKVRHATLEINVHACGTLCWNTNLCVGFHFQTMDREEGGAQRGCTRASKLGIQKNACYLWTEPCKDMENECWDDYVMSTKAHEFR